MISRKKLEIVEKLIQLIVHFRYDFTILLQVDEAALNVLSEAGTKATLRYAVQLLAPAAITAKKCGRSNVTTDDIRDIGDLFLDAKSSAKMLEANADKYML